MLTWIVLYTINNMIQAPGLHSQKVWTWALHLGVLKCIADTTCFWQLWPTHRLSIATHTAVPTSVGGQSYSDVIVGRIVRAWLSVSLYYVGVLLPAMYGR